MNIVIPMAGKGDRMKQAGYKDSKPMIDVLGKPMIKHVIDNIGIADATYYFIVQRTDYFKYNLDSYLPTLIPEGAKAVIHQLTEVTDGAARSVLHLKEYIDNDTPLMTVNSDQIIDWKEEPFRDIGKFDGCIWCFKADSDKFSYASSVEGLVTEVAEKKVISKDATAGAYYWNKGSNYVQAAQRMILADDRTRGEFYIAPVYNYMDINSAIIIRDVNDVTHLGTPEELQEFCQKSTDQE